METRECKICKRELSLKDNFYKTKEVDGKIYYRHDCKQCKSNTELERNKNLRRWFRKYKKTLSCERCGFDDWRTLHFHHSNDDKVNNVSTMVALNYGKDTIIKEIEKCTVLCANCHLIEHSKY